MSMRTASHTENMIINARPRLNATLTWHGWLGQADGPHVAVECDVATQPQQGYVIIEGVVVIAVVPDLSLNVVHQGWVKVLKRVCACIKYT